MAVQPGKFTTLQISQELNETLNMLRATVAEREGLSQLTRQQLVEKMVKVYKEHLDV